MYYISSFLFIPTGSRGFPFESGDFGENGVFGKNGRSGD